jgi:hypothetical protein
LNFSKLSKIMLQILINYKQTFFKNLFLWIHWSDFDALIFVGSEKDWNKLKLYFWKCNSARLRRFLKKSLWILKKGPNSRLQWKDSKITFKTWSTMHILTIGKNSDWGFGFLNSIRNLLSVVVFCNSQLVVSWKYFQLTVL